MWDELVDRRVAALAGDQGGVIETGQAVVLGLTTTAIGRRVERGLWHRRHRGVYAVGHPHLSARGRWFAAVLACGPRAVLSHRDAAAAWDLLPAGNGVVHVTVRTAGGRARHAGVRVHRAPGLANEDVTVVDGLPVTAVERTLADLAAIVRTGDLERAIARADARLLIDHARLAAHAARRLPGAPALRAALALPLSLTRSALENRFFALCDSAGIERPLVNSVVCGFTVDFFWPGARLVVETDGHEFHGTKTAFEEDRRRDAALTLAGYRVVRFTHERVMREGAEVVAILRGLSVA